MDKFGDMDLFVRVVKAGGLAAAGREVGLSPASVSARINSLESRYDTRLLNNVDVAVRFGQPPDSTLIARRLTTSHRKLCASPSYVKRRGKPNS